MRPSPETSPSVLWSYSWTSSSGSGAQYYQSHSYGFRAYNRTWTGANTPSFRSLRKKNLPNNPHSVVLYRDSNVRNVVETNEVYTGIPPGPLQSWNRLVWTSALMLNTALPGIGHFTDQDSRALGRAADKCAKLKFNAALAFAERRQVADLIADTATRIAQAALALRRGRFDDFYTSLGLRHGRTPGSHRSRPAGAASADAYLRDYWLSYKYGWKPLLQDVYGAAELLAYHAVNDQYHERATGSASYEYKKVDSEPTGGSLTHTQTSRTKYVLDYKLDSEASLALAQTGISNPALLAWELFPYSFILDWWLPVGNYLEALTQFDGFILSKGTKTQFSKGSFQRSYSYNWAGNNGYGNWLVTKRNGGPFVRNFAKLDRIPLSSFPSAIPPSFRNPIGDSPKDRFYTAYALMMGAFGRGKRI